MAEELGLGVNHEEFEVAQAASKEASKASLKVGAKDVLKLDVHDIAALEKDASVPKTDDSAKFGKYTVLEPCANSHTSLQVSATLTQLSRQYITKKLSFSRRQTSRPIPSLGLSLIGRVSTQRLVGKNMILAIS